jgi:dienelactone hydrolase
LTGRSIYLANRLAKHGIAGFAVDTFVARNLRPTDDYFERLQKASIYSQIIDGFNALKALQQHPYIDGENVAVTGFSLGGGSNTKTKTCNSNVFSINVWMLL